MKFASLFAITQIPLALAEGVLGVLLLRALFRIARPELISIGFLQPPAAETTGKESAHA